MWSDDPKNVTCARCRRVIQRENPTPGVTLSAPMRDMLRYLGVFRIVSPGEFIPSTLAAVERRKFVERVTVDGALYVRLTDAGRAALK
jgi:tartrate dehydratase beta subunit/fumarate hydratase class I family protein